jgi:ABC-type sugar transport system substrate-binding protein
VVGGNCLKEGLDAINTGKLQATVTQIPTDLGVRAADVINEYFGGNKLAHHCHQSQPGPVEGAPHLLMAGPSWAQV